MSLNNLLTKIAMAKGGHTDFGLAILWWASENEPTKVYTAGQIAKIIQEQKLGSPHSTRLLESLKKTKFVMQTKQGLVVKASCLTILRDRFSSMVGVAPQINQDNGYISSDIWRNTRGYVEKIFMQLNGCYAHAYYDGASVLARKSIETLLIESFEFQKRESLIKDNAGNYFMLNDLILIASKSDGLNLGRDAKKALAEIKSMGDKSAHNRRYNAEKSDLDFIRSIFRVCVQELISISEIKRVKSI